MTRRPDRDAIYDAAQRWKEECLIGDGSVFGAGTLWTVPNLDLLDVHFVQQDTVEGPTFEAKLAKQLALAGADATRLAAELLWVMMLMPTNMQASSKRDLVRKVWSWSGSELSPDDPMLGAPMEGGIANPGAGLHTNRASELTFFIRVVQDFKRLGAMERHALLGDVWQASEWLSSIQGASRPQMRHVMLHLLFPDAIEPIVTSGDRKAIIANFPSELAKYPGPREWSTDPLTAADQQVCAIREVLQGSDSDAFVNFYASPLRERWRGGDRSSAAPIPAGVTNGWGELQFHFSGTSPSNTTSRVWVIGAAEGAARWPEFLANDRIAIGWEEIGPLDQYATREAIQAAIKQVYQPRGEPLNDSLACWQFCNEMSPGDEVFVKRGRDRMLGYGVVEGAYVFDASLPDYNNVRRVRWISRGDWVLPERAWIPTKTLTDISTYAAVTDFIRPLLESGRIVSADIPYSVDDALRDVFLPRVEFERMLGSLRRRKNVILQGSPGVGKSFLARRLAYALIGHERRDDVQTVQFHQSYAYEDFVQGWRPNEKGGFELRNGVFHDFCQQAKAHPERDFVFIIDEINRGNLSKILGELMMLIEHDKRGSQFAIPLTYARSSTDTFFVPENVHILGLMNTADRSLAMVDYALRRRFAFFTLAPGFGEPAFRQALTAKGVDDAIITRIVQRVGQVNAKITGDRKNLGPGFEIGHSYFCPTEHVPNAGAWYDAVIEEEIHPLLREYWFDDRTQVDQCLALLRA